jgi:hypothetical protein
MGWISQLRAAHAFKKIIRKVENETAVLKPLIDLETGILSASWQSAEEFKECLSKLPLTKHDTISREKLFNIFLEFLFFFLHFANRQAYGRLPQAKANNLLQTMGEFLVSCVIDTSVGHWPEEYKTGVQSETYDNLNQAEKEYATCKQLMEPTLPSGYVRARLDDNALLSRLAFHVLSHTRSDIDAEQIDPETAVLADMIQIVVTSKLFEKKLPLNSDLVPAMSYGTLFPFGPLVDRASAALEAYEHDGRSLREVRREAREFCVEVGKDGSEQSRR